MSQSNDPYKYHPELRGKIADPMQSRFRNMDLTVVDASMRAAGEPENWRMSDDEREAHRLETLQDWLSGDIWLFGYGSLIWDPGICFDEVRVGRLHGYHRRFCLRSELGRGSREKPGLMVGLDQGGLCDSLLFRIPQRLLHEETRLIWKREMLRLSYRAQFLPVQTGQGKIQALTFVIDPASATYRPQITLDEAAQYVATGEGLYGSSFDYLSNLVSHLDAFGIEDAAVHELYERSACLVDAGK